LLAGYIKSVSAFLCPSNDFAWKDNDAGTTNAPGDESNIYYKPLGKKDGPQIPVSYGINGMTFHEGVPTQWGEVARGREESEIKNPTELIFVGESRVGHPDIYPDWLIGSMSTNPALGHMQTHNHGGNWVLADTHAKWMKIQTTFSPKEMWQNPGDPIQVHTQKDYDNMIKNVPAEYK
jgi:hypothetical protein